MKVSLDSTTFTTEKDHYKTTYLRKELNGETSKRIEFYNEAGQLRGKSVYNAFGEREVQIEFDGKRPIGPNYLRTIR